MPHLSRLTLAAPILVLLFMPGLVLPSLALPGLARPASAQPMVPPTSTARSNPAYLTADQVTTILRARGYSDVGEVLQEGDTFRIPEATRYGEKVQNLRIDALTGQAREQPLLTEAQASALLRDRGYSAVKELGREGDLIRLQAVRDGTPVELRVDARTGAVRQ